MDCKTITLRTRVLKHGMLGFYVFRYSDLIKTIFCKNIFIQSKKLLFSYVIYVIKQNHCKIIP